MAIPTNLDPKTWPAVWMFQAYRGGTLYAEAAFADAQKEEVAMMGGGCRPYAAKKAAEIINGVVAEVNSDPYAFNSGNFLRGNKSADKRLKMLDDEIRKHPQCATGVPQKAMKYLRHAYNAERNFRTSVGNNIARQYLGPILGESSACVVSMAGSVINPVVGLISVAGSVGGIAVIVRIVQQDERRVLKALAPNPILPLSPENIAAMMQYEAEQWAAFNSVTP